MRPAEERENMGWKAFIPQLVSRFRSQGLESKRNTGFSLGSALQTRNTGFVGASWYYTSRQILIFLPPVSSPNWIFKIYIQLGISSHALKFGTEICNYE
jgi:hypothetical protein